MSGKPGKQYGLIKSSGRVAGPTKVPAKNPFADDDDDDDDDDEGDAFASRQSVNAMLQRKQLSSRSQIAAEAVAKKALAEDPSIYAYDDLYDDMKAKTEEKEREQREKFKSERESSQYMENIRKSAALRQRERDRQYERKLQKESAVDADQFEDKAKYITSAYKKKLEEHRKWDYYDKLNEEMEQRDAVEKKGMDTFYSNLLTKNIALGADVKTSAKSAYTVGSKVQDAIQTGKLPSKEEAQKQKDNGKPSKTSDSDGEECSTRVSEERRGRSDRSDDRGRKSEHGSRKRSRSRSRNRSRERRSRSRDRRKEERRSGRDRSRDRDERGTRREGDRDKERDGREHRREREERREETPKVEKEEGSKKDKEEAIRLARERFLQRKKAQAGGPT